MSPQFKKNKKEEIIKSSFMYLNWTYFKGHFFNFRWNLGIQVFV